MADDFDLFPKQALTPETRDADRAFVARVQAGIVLEARIRAERAAIRAGLVRQIGAVLALAGALLWLSRSPDLTGVISDSPAVILGVLIALFSLLIVVLTGGSERDNRHFSAR